MTDDGQGSPPPEGAPTEAAVDPAARVPTATIPADRPRGPARLDRFLTPDRLAVYPTAIAVLFAVFWAASVAFVGPLPDFVARWTAGRLVLDGRETVLYDPVVQSMVQRDLGSTELSWFVSPPYVGVLFAPFALVPYPVAAALWTLVSVGLLWVAARSLVGLDPSFERLRGWRALLIAGSCQVVLELLGSGQDSALVLAAFVLGARVLASGRGVLAGLVLSVAAIKPQLLLLVPFVLLGRRAWGALGGLVLGGLALVGGSVAVLGTQVWVDWLQALSSPLYRTQVVSGQTAKNTSLHGLLEHLVPGDGWFATGLWVVGVVVVLGLALRHREAWRSLGLPVLLVTLVPLTTVLVSPHAMVYDLVIVYPAVAWLLHERASAELRGLVAIGFVLLFLSPFVQLVAQALPAVSVIAAPWVVVVLVGLWWRWVGGTGPAGPRGVAQPVAESST